MNESYNLLDLKENHKALLFKYLQFFKSKKEKVLKEISLTVDDFSST